MLTWRHKCINRFRVVFSFSSCVMTCFLRLLKVASQTVQAAQLRNCNMWLPFGFCDHQYLSQSLWMKGGRHWGRMQFFFVWSPQKSALAHIWCLVWRRECDSEIWRFLWAVSCSDMQVIRFHEAMKLLLLLCSTTKSAWKTLMRAHFLWWESGWERAHRQVQ